MLRGGLAHAEYWGKQVPALAALWIVTGNNVAMNDEMARRSVRIRLDAGVEEPWHRQGFRHDPLLEWADKHRGELVRAALILVANWLARGAQPFTERTLGSFEAWARIVGGVLRDAGIEGFLQGRQQMRSEVDRDSASWTAFFEVWWRKHSGQPMTAGELVAIAPKSHRACGLPALTSLSTSKAPTFQTFRTG